MTDQELKDLVASLAEDTKIMKAEAVRRDADLRQEIAETSRVVASLAEDTKIMKAEAVRRDADLRQEIAETSRVVRELAKQIGGISNKFGTFTEGLSLPSVQRLLFDRFDVEDFMPRRRRRVNGEMIELDALGIVNGSRNEAYIVEIKSHLRMDGIEQLRSTVQRFRAIFPEYTDKKVFGLLVAADASSDAVEACQKAGFYLITFEDDIMRFHDENGFTAKAY